MLSLIDQNIEIPSLAILHRDENRKILSDLVTTGREGRKKVT